MRLEFKRLTEMDCSEYIALNTNPLMRRQMPLTSDTFDEEENDLFVIEYMRQRCKTSER